jgi:hypothetical protein
LSRDTFNLVRIGDSVVLAQQPTPGRAVSDALPRDAVIRTPDQRVRVFVSSTLGELADERRAVSRAISVLRLTPVMFELGARPHPPRELYRAYLAQSDIFIGLYWQRYGQVGPGMELSGLEDEFERSRPHVASSLASFPRPSSLARDPTIHAACQITADR